MSSEGSCDSWALMRVARAYSKLGTATQVQVDRVLENGAFILDDLVAAGELNPNAMKNAKHFFKVYDEAVGEDEAMWLDIEKWLAEREA